MSKPIEGCPVEEKPMRDRAYTDRQLLELAAKAAGIHLQWIGDAPKEITTHWSGNYEEGEQLREWDWNPLTDDGDALRLVVKLDLLIDVCTISGGIRATQVLWPACGPSRITEEHGSDPYAATRRAIVRAAAAIAEGAKS